MWVKQKGFTIVELLIVTVVIGILAAITVVAYNGIQNRAQNAALLSDLNGASKQLQIYQTLNDVYPTTLDAVNNGTGIKSSPGVNYRYSPNNTSTLKSFCLAAYNSNTIYMTTESTTPTPGSCVNLALGRTSPSALLTDGSTITNPYYGMGAGLQSVTVDLGYNHDISSLKIWHFFADARTYYNTKTEVSIDNSTWNTVFDSTSDGTYTETATGKTTLFPMRKVRYIRDWLNGSTSNTSNHWVEIQAF